MAQYLQFTYVIMVVSCPNKLSETRIELRQ